MGNQEALARAEVACAVTIFRRRTLNVRHPASNVAPPELKIGVESWALGVDCLVQMPGRGLEPLIKSRAFGDSLGRGKRTLAEMLERSRTL